MQAVETREAHDETDEARRHKGWPSCREHHQDEHAEAFIAHAAAMRDVRSLVQRVARTSAAVLVRGETGTGKELVARAVHAASARAQRKLYSINCGAIPDTLIGSVLFGHTKGSFTGASEDKPGMFELAHGSTLLLDEIGELSSTAQVALLRVLETRTCMRIGSTRELPVDVRIVAATHRDLRAMARDGTFREDLLHRIDVLRVQLPALRERREDIARLAQHFAALIGGEWGGAPYRFTDAALAALAGHDWPGNVRELRNVVTRGAALCDHHLIDVDDLRLCAPPATLACQAPAGATPPRVKPSRDLRRALREYELEVIGAALKESGDDRRAAARGLGISLRTLERRMQSLRETGSR